MRKSKLEDVYLLMSGARRACEEEFEIILEFWSDIVYGMKEEYEPAG